MSELLIGSKCICIKIAGDTFNLNTYGDWVWNSKIFTLFFGTHTTSICKIINLF